MHINDLNLIRGIAHDPDTAMRYVLSPQVGYEEAWIQSPSIKKIFRYMARTALAGGHVSWLSIVSNVDISEVDSAQILAAWKDGKANPQDLPSAITAAKSDYIIRSGEESIKEYHDRIAEDKSRVREYLSSLGVNISMLAREGVNYDPRPSSHLNDKELTRNGTWGDRALNEMFSESGSDKGGRPSYGFIVASCPTGTGKTTLAITMLAYTVAYSTDRALAMSNEMPRSKYSKGVLRAVKALYADEEYEESILKRMDEQMVVYAPGTTEDDGATGFPVKKFETMRQIMFWEKPQFAVIDSLNGVDFPAFASTRDQNALHAAKADAFRDTALEYGCLLYAPGNMSEEKQRELVNTPEKVSSVMIFQSTAYNNASDYSFLGWQPKERLGVQNFKRCKNRHGTSRGEVWTMNFDYTAGIYRMPN